jgi:hypothetical protein
VAISNNFLDVAGFDISRLRSPVTTMFLMSVSKAMSIERSIFSNTCEGEFGGR